MHDISTGEVSHWVNRKANRFMKYNNSLLMMVDTPPTREVYNKLTREVYNKLTTI